MTTRCLFDRDRRDDPLALGMRPMTAAEAAPDRSLWWGAAAVALLWWIDPTVEQAFVGYLLILGGFGLWSLGTGGTRTWE